MSTIRNVMRATLVLVGMGLLVANVAAQPTSITVRVLAKDA